MPFAIQVIQVKSPRGWRQLLLPLTTIILAGSELLHLGSTITQPDAEGVRSSFSEIS
jgi:hypothetical protein